MEGKPSRSRAAPTVEEVRRITAIADPVVRNLEITRCYSLLAAALGARLGEGANWCTFATWASRQAGRTIRGEDLLGELGRRLDEGRWLLHPIATLWRRLLRRGLFRRDTRLGRLTSELHTPFDAFERASECVARGNLKVFEEIGLAFAGYLDLEAPDERESPELSQFLDGLRTGDPPDGQGYLRRAFSHYERGRLERDPKAQAELVVLANLEIGFHEQTRLQPEIRASLDAPLATQEDLGLRALEVLLPSARRWWSVVRRPAAAVAGAFASGAQRAASRLARETITESFMVLSLPERVLALGSNLPDSYPEPLREPGIAELTELLARFEPVPPAPDDCGVRDWSDLEQRMHYIAHLFCAFHLDARLGRAPFTEAQVASFTRGVVPDGEL